LDQLTAFQKLVESYELGTWMETVEGSINDLGEDVKTLEEKLQALLDQKLQDQINGIKSDLTALGKSIDEKDTALKLALEKHIKEVTDAINETIRGINTALETNTKDIEELKKSITDAEKAITALQKDLGIAIKDLAQFLKSLVFVPQAYFNGIPASVVSSYTFTPIVLTTTEAADVTKDQTDNAYKENKTAVETKLPFTASYRLNPDNANTNYIGEVILASQNVAVYTRNNDEVTFTTDKPTFENGVMTVTAKLAGGKIPAGDKEVAMFNAKVNYEVPSTKEGEEAQKAVISSDYAAIYEDVREIKNTLQHGDNINNTLYNNANNGQNTTFKSVAYNSKGIDLSESVKAQYIDKKDGNKVKAFDNDKLEKYGLAYKFELIGDNSDNSAWGTITGSTFRPQLAEKGSDGKWRPKASGEQGAGSLGKSPLVRALLMHGEDIVAVGYFRLKIVDIETPEAPIQYSFKDPFSLATGAASIPMKVTWDQLESALQPYGITGRDIDLRWKYYTIYTGYDNGTGTGELYSYYRIAETPLQEDRSGSSDVERFNYSSKTALQWNEAANSAYETLYTLKMDEKKPPMQISRFIEFVNYDGNSIWVELLWKPSAVNITPAGTIKVETRKPDHLSGEGLTEARLRNEGNTYSADMEDWFYLTGSDLTTLVTLNSEYKDLDIATPTFKFSTKQNKAKIENVINNFEKVTYSLKGNGNYIEAYDKDDQFVGNVAYISGTTITLLYTPEALAILNHTSRSDWQNAFTANVVIDVKTLEYYMYKIEGFGPNNQIPVEMNGSNLLNVKFARPIDIDDINITFDGSDTKVLAPVMKDYNGEQFFPVKYTTNQSGTSVTGGSPTLSAAYMTDKAIQLNMDKATTIINGKEASLKDNYPEIYNSIVLANKKVNAPGSGQTATAAKAYTEIGSLQYTAPANVVRNQALKFTAPLKIPYITGDIYVKVNITINPTN
jgi:hypothetical protein